MDEPWANSSGSMEAAAQPSPVAHHSSYKPGSMGSYTQGTSTLRKDAPWLMHWQTGDRAKGESRPLTPVFASDIWTSPFRHLASPFTLTHRSHPSREREEQEDTNRRLRHHNAGKGQLETQPQCYFPSVASHPLPLQGQ